jgi:hypothetical protein
LADFDKAIPPGGKGKITLVVRTEGRSGELLKSARIISNDPSKKTFAIYIKALVKSPIYLSPKSVYLYGNEGQQISRAINVTAGLDRSLELEPVDFNLGRFVKYDIQEMEEGKLFQINFTNRTSKPQVYQGFLKLKTNYPERPEIIIHITGRIRAITKTSQ